MKIKSGFILREVMGKKIVVANGEASKSFRGMIKLNETAADIWTAVEQGKTVEETADLLVEKYDVAREKALADTIALCKKMTENGVWEE